MRLEYTEKERGFFKIIHAALKVPFLWSLSQILFGCDRWKMSAYRSVFRDSGRILDFGCANGNTFPIFREFEYYGLDCEERVIRNAREKYREYPNAHFVSADILKDNPFEADFFDEILFACTGHHLEETKLRAILSALGRLLRPEGKLHFFDTVRSRGEEHWFAEFKLRHDRGRYIRTDLEYERIFQEGGLGLEVLKTKKLIVDESLTPQPAYYYVCFGKNRDTTGRGGQR